MKIDDFNELVETAAGVAAPSIARLETIFTEAFARSTRYAVNQFKSATFLTASAWTPPITYTLASGLSEDEQNEADLELRSAVDQINVVYGELVLAAISPSVFEALRQRAIQNYGDALYDTLKSVVDNAFTSGLSAEETAQVISQAFVDVGPTTASMMAETMIATISNERSLTAANQAFAERPQPVFKVWETRKDARVRPAHSATEGQTRPLDQPFSVGGFSMMFPGDPSGPINLVARCRCSLSYSESLTASTAKEDEMGVVETEPLTAAVTITIDDSAESDAVEASEEAAAAPIAWSARLAIEGQETEDLRLINNGALTWRDLPLTLMAMDETSAFGGHDGAKVAGKITEISRVEGEATNDIDGAGVFDTGDYGQEIARMVGEQTLRGNSVDLAVNEYEYRNADTGEVLEGDAIWDAFFEDIPILFVVLDGVILASTVCPTPAINGAEIMLASGRKQMFFGPPKEGAFVMNFHHDDWLEKPAEDVLTAGAAGMAPLHPPLAWFDDPVLDGPTPLTVQKDGRVYGHAALWNSCHIGEPSGPGICVPPPRSGMGYSVFHHGVCETAEGIDVPCGQITLGTTHASSNLTWQQTIEHYEHTGMAVADVVAGEDAYGIWVSGGLRPSVPAEKVREMKAGSISGDWRTVINRGLEFVAALVVNVGGFPVPRPEARVVASAAGEEEVLALVAAGMVPPAEEVDGLSRRDFLRKIEALTH